MLSPANQRLIRAVIASALFCLLSPLRAETVLRVLSWQGYADPDVVKVFEQRHQVRVELTEVESDTVLWQKITSGGSNPYDVFAVNTAELVRYRNAGLVQPIDAARVPRIATQLPQFREEHLLPDIFQFGKRYAVPYTYAEMGLIYDPQAFASPPDSIAALWNPALRGKVLAYDGGSHAFSLAAMKTRLPSPFRIPPSQWKPLAVELIDLRRNVLGFYSRLEDSLRLWRERGAVLLFANYGSQQLKLFRRAGLKVGYAIPREGALAWLDCWAIASATRQPDLAAKWIDYMLEPQVGARLVDGQGLSSTLQEGSAPKDARRIWLQPVEDVERRELLWGRIVAGDRLPRVLSQ